MRPTPSSETVPASVSRYLLSHERIVIAVRHHLAILIPSLTSALGGMLAAGAVTSTIKNNNRLVLLIWILVGLLCLRVYLACFYWHEEYLVVTTQRIVLIFCKHGKMRVRSIPLEDIKKMTLQHSSGSRALGYGTFIFDTGDMGYVVVDYLPSPEQHYLEVNELVFRDREQPPE